MSSTPKYKIAVNTRFLLKDKLEGIGWFTYESMKRMVQNHPEVEFHFLFDRPYDKRFIFGDNVVPHVLFPPARHPILWYMWFEFSVPRALKKIKPDLFISTDGYASLKTKVPTLLVIHDLAFEHFDDHLPTAALKYYRKYTPLYARKAHRIATVSQFSKQDIGRYGIIPDKIDVVYNGANPIYQPLDSTEKLQAQAVYAAGQPYFIYVGSLHPRKNISRLLRAFDDFKQSSKSDVQLLIVGAKGWQTQEMELTYKSMKHKEEVHFAGHLQPEQLKQAIGGALAMCYVSLFEGFGIPLVEALQAGVPCIASKTSSMPEAAGEGAILVDPTKVHDIADAMKLLYENEGLREGLVSKGQQHIQQFSWDKTAERLWKGAIKILEYYRKT